jgi:nitrilase
MNTGENIIRHYKVAIIQQAPVFLDLNESVQKAGRLIADSASQGASLVVFGETWLPGYPIWASFDARFNSPFAKAVYRHLFENSVEIPGPITQRLGEICKKAGVHLAMGVHERVSSGTLYNCIVFMGPNGELIGKHRKLVPTYHERMIWGQGDGSTLEVFDTTLGRLGGLICYEHLMPLARYTLYTKGIQIHTALWPCPVKPYIVACQNMAAEGRLFVAVACTCYPESTIKSLNFEVFNKITEWPAFLSQGGSFVIGPDGEFLIEPVPGDKTVYIDIDLDRIVEEKLIVDAVGHYARPEVFTLQVNTAPLKPIEFLRKDPKQ